MKFVLALTALAVLFALSSAAPSHSHGRTLWYHLESGYTFEQYVKEHQKEYESPAEMAMRRAIFENNLQRIKEHNRNPSATWKAGVNHLTDRTEEEFQALLGHKSYYTQHPEVVARRAQLVSKPALKTSALPDYIDWRAQGALTPVKDQGQCGSCWTFAAAEAIESAVFLKTGQLYELSQQQIASCTSNPLKCGGSGGCSGGTAEVAFQGVIDAGGLASEWTYPYISWNGTDYQCRLNDTSFKFRAAAKLSSYVQLPVNDQDALLTAVATVGPIAISVDASSWSKYESGIFSGCNTTNPVINHAVQLAGYGSETGQDYWIVRNSWTPKWGEGGFIRIARPANPTCGIDSNPGDGTACMPYPATQTVCGMCGILSDSAYPVLA